MKKTPIKKPAPKAHKPRALKSKDKKISSDFYGRTKAQIKLDLKKDAKRWRESVLRAHCETDEKIKAMVDNMVADSKKDTEAQRAYVESLKGPVAYVSDVESYVYTTFPAPIQDYLDYIKSTKNNLNSWGDLKSFIKTTDGFWKIMRNQSCKMAIKFAQDKLEAREGCCDKAYLNQIIGIYIDELRREMSYNSSSLLSNIADMISDYREHEQRVEWQIAGRNKDDE